MNQSFADTDVIDIVMQALVVCVKIAGPPLAATLIVGLAVSLFQAVFQVQDQSLPMVLKMAAAAVVLVILGPWDLRLLVDFMTQLYAAIPQWTG